MLLETNNSRINVVVTVFTADMPAHPSLLVMKSTNECASCKVKGGMVRPRETGGHRMTFPKIGVDWADADFRSSGGRFGHKGLSSLSNLLNFDMARDCNYESMHPTTNVVRRLTCNFFPLWISTPGYCTAGVGRRRCWGLHVAAYLLFSVKSKKPALSRTVEDNWMSAIHPFLTSDHPNGKAYWIVLQADEVPFSDPWLSSFKKQTNELLMLWTENCTLHSRSCTTKQRLSATWPTEPLLSYYFEDFFVTSREGQSQVRNCFVLGPPGYSPEEKVWCAQVKGRWHSCRRRQVPLHW